MVSQVIFLNRVGLKVMKSLENYCYQFLKLVP